MDLNWSRLNSKVFVSGIVGRGGEVDYRGREWAEKGYYIILGREGKIQASNHC